MTLVNGTGDRKEALEFMARAYCTRKHGASGMCDQCAALLDYAFDRIDSCPNHETGVRCKGCPTRCYNRDMAGMMEDLLDSELPRLVLHPNMLKKFCNW